MFLENNNFDQALGMWSLGCVAVELLSRKPLFRVEKQAPCASDYLLLHLNCLGSPGKPALEFLSAQRGLPCDLDVLRRVGECRPPSPTFRQLLRPRHLAAFANESLQ